MVQMNDAKVAKALRQIAPRHPGAAAIELGIDKQATVDCGRRPRMASPAGQKGLNALSLGICQSVAACHAPDHAA
jgi:hypothetical protein